MSCFKFDELSYYTYLHVHKLSTDFHVPSHCKVSYMQSFNNAKGNRSPRDAITLHSNLVCFTLSPSMSNQIKPKLPSDLLVDRNLEFELISSGTVQRYASI